jgi:hypothetical protein
MRIPTLLATLLFLAATAVAAPSPQPITVDYPANNSLFPPDIASPTFLWRDPNPAVTHWRIEIKFSSKAKPILLESKGEPMPIGEIDLECKKAGALDPTPTAEQAQQHSWQPDDFQWNTIKKNSVEKPAVVTFTGFADAASKDPLSRGTVSIVTSSDPVGSPIFFRDVPLISVPVGERGVIMPLPAGAVPLIAWRLRHVNERKSRLMMQGLPTCANCHSFSKDGATLGLDVDGPQNDKGLYGLVPVARNTSIRNKDVIRWSSFNETPALKRFGFMSQVSPDGQFVIT